MKNSRDLEVQIGDRLLAIYPTLQNVDVISVDNDSVSVENNEGTKLCYRYFDFGKTLFFCEKDFVELKQNKPLSDIRYSIYKEITHEARIERMEEIYAAWRKLSYYDFEFLHEKEHFKRVMFEVEKNLKRAKEFNNSMKFYGESVHNKNWSGYIPAQDRNDPCNDYSLQTQIKDEPYFAKVDSQITGEFYIGKNATQNFVIDWRDSERANVYFNYNILVGREDVGLRLIRDFEIDKELHGFSDRYNSIQGIDQKSNYAENGVIYDEFLTKILEKNRMIGGIHDIVQSIRSEQYELITRRPNENMMVSGCAGSGKTMIMIHRISYLTYNYPEVNNANTFIVSPNQILNKEATLLAAKLGLDTFPLTSATDLFEKIIGEYSLEDTTTEPNRRITSNWKIKREIVENIFTHEFQSEFLKRTESICLNPSSFTYGLNPNGQEYSFMEKEEQRLIAELKRIVKMNFESNDLSYILSSINTLHDMAKDYEAILNTLSKVNVGAKLFGENRAVTKPHEIMKYRIEAETSSSKKAQLKEKYDILLHYYETNMLTGKPIYNLGKKGSGDAGIKDVIFKEAYEFHKKYDALSKDEKPELLAQALLMFFKKKERFDEYIQKGIWEGYAYEIISGIVDDFKMSKGISVDNNYEFESFLRLQGLNGMFGHLDSEYRLFMIDEYQDYSTFEISLIRKIYPNSIINLFGDPNQTIALTYGFATYASEFIDAGMHRFNLNINYRNSKEITEYINNKIGLNMVAVGLQGRVENISINDVGRVFENCTNCALIVKNRDMLNLISKAVGLEYTYIDDDRDTSPNKIKILPIYYAKGLEFEKVIVYAREMTKNEKYIAFSRALSELYVIEE